MTDPCIEEPYEKVEGNYTPSGEYSRSDSSYSSDSKYSKTSSPYSPLSHCPILLLEDGEALLLESGETIAL